jgi:outer membrane protein assembly factor BamB
LNGPAGVQRVASTGFGHGWVLCQQNNATQLYAYDSPYIFKTGEQYNVAQAGVLEAGLGNLYLISRDSTGNNTLVALNAQTGQPLWTHPFGPGMLTQPVFDPLQELIYTGDSCGYLAAWQARDGKLAWLAYVGSSIDAPPALAGKQLCFGASNGMVYMFNTDEALQSYANDKPPTPVWTYQTETGTRATSVQTPLLANGQVYVVTWQDNSTSTGEQYNDLVTQLDARTGAYSYSIDLSASERVAITPIAPVLGRAAFDTGPTPALFVNTGSSIAAVSLTTPGVFYHDVKAPQHGGTNYFSSPMMLSDQGALFVGDYEGNLYALDAGLRPLYDTLCPMDPGAGIFTKPIIVTDDQGNGTALVGSLGGTGV